MTATILALTQEPSPLWYFARAAGFVSLVLLAATVALGLAVAMRWRSPRMPSFISEGLHRYLTTVVYVFIVIHVVTILLDPFTKFSLTDVLVPFASSYRTLWMGLGICAFELSLALGLSIYVRGVIGYRAWRLLHYGTYLTFPIALVHGLGTGSDTRTWWGLAFYAVCGLAVVTLALMRLLSVAGAEPAGVARATPG